MKKILPIILISIMFVLTGCSTNTIEEHLSYSVTVASCNALSGDIKITLKGVVDSSLPEGDVGGSAIIVKGIFYGGYHMGSIAISVKDAKVGDEFYGEKTFDLDGQWCNESVTYAD